MQVEDIEKYCLSKNKAYIKYPFEDVPICFKVNYNIVKEFCL